MRRARGVGSGAFEGMADGASLADDRSLPNAESVRARSVKSSVFFLPAGHIVVRSILSLDGLPPLSTTASSASAAVAGAAAAGLAARLLLRERGR